MTHGGGGHMGGGGHSGGHVGGHSGGHVGGHTGGGHIGHETGGSGGFGNSTDPNANPLNDPNSPLNPANTWMRRSGSRYGGGGSGISVGGGGRGWLLGIVLAVVIPFVGVAAVAIEKSSNGTPSNGIRTTMSPGDQVYNGDRSNTMLGTLTISTPSNVGYGCSDGCGVLTFSNPSATSGPKLVETDVQSATGGGEFDLAPGVYHDVQVRDGGKQWSVSITPGSGD